MSDAVIPIRYRLRVKQRLVVLAYAEEHGLKPAARHFALGRTTVREWRDRHRDHAERCPQSLANVTVAPGITRPHTSLTCPLTSLDIATDFGLSEISLTGQHNGHAKDRPEERHSGEAHLVSPPLQV